MNPLVASVIRTLVPNIVTQISAWLLLANIPLLPTTLPMVSAVVGFILFAFYYVGVRVIEQQWPAFGVLLGLPKSPDTYSKSVDTAAVPAAPTKGADTGPGLCQGDGHGTAQADVPASPASFSDTQAKIDAATEVSAPALTAPVVSAPEVTAPDVQPAVSPAQ